MLMTFFLRWKPWVKNKFEMRKPCFECVMLEIPIKSENIKLEMYICLSPEKQSKLEFQK